MALFLGALILVAFKIYNDVVTDVGSTLQEVKQITLEQIAKKDFDLPRYTAQIRDACKKLPPGVREATMMNLGSIVKNYVQSPSFQSEYFAFVENQAAGGRSSAPNAGRRGPAPMDDAKWADEKKKRVDRMVNSMSNPDLVKMYAETLDPQIDAAQSKLELLQESPDAKLGISKEELQKEHQDLKKLKELYGKDLEAFKVKYAEYTVDKQLASQMNRNKENEALKQKRIDELKDYKSIIANQLKQFLDLSATVDFNAKTTKKGDIVVFIDPAYEAKPASWKLCYRCGKEAVTGARKFATQWLNEMKAGE